ncbi:MAG TPA: DUF1571 domain-containing protein [Gemmata sp.]
MIRTIALCSLVVLLAGCTKYHSRAQGPFSRNERELPPPYGTTNKPVANQSPLAIGSPAPAALSGPDERAVIPPRAAGTAPAAVAPPAELDDPNTFPPFRKRPDPKALPSPFAPDAPKAPSPEPQAPAKGLAELKTVLATASAAWRAVDTFEGTLTRRELNPQGAPTSEVVLFQFRREPMAVFTRTISEKGKGREVVYNPSKHEDKLHVMVGAGDHPLFKAGRILPGVSPDSPLVKEKTRYSIRDAGFSKHLTKLGDTVAKVEAGKLPATALAFHGEVKRDEYPHPLTGVSHNLRPGDDPLLPAGGTRTYFFDLKDRSPSYGLPVLIVTTDAAGKEAEYYLFQKIKLPAHLTDADFSPERLGKK